jgi:hypothetical protein
MTSTPRSAFPPATSPLPAAAAVCASRRVPPPSSSTPSLSWCQRARTPARWVPSGAASGAAACALCGACTRSLDQYYLRPAAGADCCATPPARCAQVAQIAKAAAKAVATDRAVLRRLLQLCLPADLLNSLDIEALIDAMVASTVVEVEISGGSSNGSNGGSTPPGAKAAPPSAAGKTTSIEVKQRIPGVKAADVRLLHCLGSGLLVISSPVTSAPTERMSTDNAAAPTTRRLTPRRWAAEWPTP